MRFEKYRNIIEDAVEFCKAVMPCFVKAENIVLKRILLQAIWEELGACPYKEAAAKFLPEADARIGTLLGSKNNIQ